MRSVAVIGSFKQHYEPVLAAIKRLQAAGITVTTPAGTAVVEQRDFVRFESDPGEWDDSYVQSVTLHRILRADAVYVVTPNGYIGRTTCYEVGRIVQARRPIYFSELPDDLPIFVPEPFVMGIEAFTELVGAGRAEWMFESGDTPHARSERDLATGQYSDV